ncbi:hypothetical protein GCM10007897_41380 [Sphingobium jiangsuense]|uniref:Rhamnogalacturonase A/B/Epimerase-like pectate lyase domain-containing protein n=1 Tax=Sphingobium jiangsuense TaxID=870476 RepID=A0A7W6BMF3_9SPHN|nr:glycosyl hydrolase family 28-related protein [Sphingobium jiangsuense]MBB3927812.1 hypothetical protein [Sphingobium jiangsuense]GLT02716.1 hypothetical protein GCM10007897_41380 [Sphingobium jiangsuense]
MAVSPSVRINVSGARGARGATGADNIEISQVLGVPAGSLNLGTFNGDIIPDNSSAKQALQALEDVAVRKRNEFVSIVDFGAVEGGVVDCTSALEAALTASKRIYIPAGKFRFNSPITHIFSPSATGPSDDKSSYDQIEIYGAGADASILYFPSSDGLEFQCSSFQHIVRLRDFSLTTGQAGGGTTALKITNSFAYFGEYNGHHHIDITIRGDDGYAAAYYWSTYIDLFNASNISFGKSCNLYGPVLGATDNTYGLGVRIASDPNPGTGSSGEPGWGTSYDLTGIKLRFLGCAIEIGAGVQGFSLGPGTELTVGYDGIRVIEDVTEVRQINLTGAQISVNGDSIYLASGVPSCVISGGYIGVAPGKNGIVFASNDGAANGGGTIVAGITFVALGPGAGDGVYVGTSFNPIVIDNCCFNGLGTGIELAATSSQVTVGSSNRYANCTNSVIDLGTGNIVAPANLTGNGVGFGESVTQETSKSTGVTLHSPAGRVITHDATLSSGARASFLLTNSKIGHKDVVSVSSSNGNYRVWTAGASDGERAIYIENIDGSSHSDAVTINFVVEKAAQL